MQQLQLVKDDYRQHPILQQFYDDLPSKPYCSDVKDFCKVRPKAIANKQSYIQPNHPLCIKWLVIDIDSPFKHTSTEPYYDENLLFRCYDRNLAEPTFIARNPSNGHVQYFYRLKDPVTMYQASHAHPMRYLKSIQYAYNVQLGGDFGFGGSLAKNPLDTSTWEIFITGAGSYTLNELAEFVDLTDPINKPPKKATNDDQISPFAGLGRNCDTFDYLRFIAYSIANSMTQTALFNHLLALGLEFNSRFEQPLLYSEIRCIARSIAKFCKTSPRYRAYATIVHERKSAMGRKGALVANSKGACAMGGKARSDKYADKRTIAHEMRESGLSNTEIASKLGVARLTVIRWFK